MRPLVHRLLVLLAICQFAVPSRTQDVRWDSPWGAGPTQRGPEPRAFGSLAGLTTTSTLYLYGGFSHARNAWLGDVWSLQLSAPSWVRLDVKLGDLDSPMEHATLVPLGASLLLVGGRHGNGDWSDKLYLLDLVDLRWRALSTQSTPSGPDSVPRLYWHSALPYKYGGTERVLLSGGLDANGAAIASVYELSVDSGGGSYSITTLGAMSTPLFGHSLAADSNSEFIYVTGGLTGRLTSLPREAVPPGLRGALELQLPAIGSTSVSPPPPPAGGGVPAASHAVYRLNRTGASGAGTWEALGDAQVMPRGVAFHASWVKGSTLYLYGGAQTALAQGPDAAASPFGPQAFTLPAAPAASGLAFAAVAAQAAVAQWGAVRPGWVSGAAVWLDGSVPADSQPSVWLFGGWATPQPLQPWADSYLAPQDSSLLWRHDGGASPAAGGGGGSGGAGQWMPPVQGGMAPRSGAMVVAVTVGGARKLLSVGGRASGGWAAASTGGSHFLTNPIGLTFGPTNDPRVVATSYHFSDIWLIDQATGAREAIWFFNSTSVPAAGPCLPPYASASLGPTATANCTSLPFGSSASPAGGWPFWDRRLLESPVTVLSSAGGGGATTGAPGGTNHAIYMHAAEVTSGAGGVPALQSGIWRLSISTSTLPAPIGATPNRGAGNSTIYVGTWQELTPPASNPDPSPCYPRTLHGAAHLSSTSAGASTATYGGISYVAIFGGLLLTPSAVGTDPARMLSLTATDSVCLLDVTYRRWLQPPVYPTGNAPEARYRGACASRSGVANYSMTCYGGVSAAGGAALSDAWTFSLQPGTLPAAAASVQLQVHLGSWSYAPANATAVRPLARADPLMVTVRGPGVAAGAGPTTTTTTTSSTYSPLVLIGGSLNASGDLPRRDVWVLEAQCGDPDALVPSASAGPRPPQTAQVWLSVEPTGSMAAAATAAALPEPWVAVAASTVQSEASLEVWVAMLPSSGVSDLRFARMAAPLEGCMSIRPNCSRLSYALDLVAGPCWPGSSVANPILVTAADGGPLPTTGLFTSSMGFVLKGPDGVPVHFKNSTMVPNGYFLNDIHLPPSLTATDLTVTAYGRPVVEVDRQQVVAAATPGGFPRVGMTFNRTTLTFTVRANGSLLANTTAELRVLYNSLYRKRRCVAWPPYGDCDVSVTDAKGSATFDIFPVQAAQASTVSYAAIISTPYYYGTYAVALPSPYTTATGGSSTSTGAGGGIVTLLPGGGASGSAIAYSIDVPSSLAPAPPPDGRVPVTVTISFRQSMGYSVLNLPTNRRWIASFYRRYSSGGIESDPALNISDGYSIASKPYPRRLPPGEFLVWVTDSLLPSPPMLETTRNIDGAAAAAAGGSTVITLEVLLSTVTFRLFFSRVVVSPGAGFYVGASTVFVSLYTVPEDAAVAAAAAAAVASGSSGTVGDGSGSGGGSSNTTGLTAAVGTAPASAGGMPGVPWDSELTDGGLATFSLIPGTTYLAVFSYPSVVLRGPVTITAPVVVSGSGSSSGGSSGGSSSGGGAVYDYELPQALLCATGTTTLINQQRGRFPSDYIGTVVYGPGTTCSWVITTGQPLMNLMINYTGLAPGDFITLTTDTGFVTRLPTLVDADSVFAIRMTASNVTIRFRANNDNLMGSGPIVVWEGLAQQSSMPPQFIMMIAASSAAAGAMMLFLCLWHCVFRPVQLRRQAAAAAMAAAAAAATAAGAAGPPGVRAAGHRNRVPRRYLRMMETSLYSAKEVAARAAAKAAALSATAHGTIATAAPAVAAAPAVVDGAAEGGGAAVAVSAMAAAAAPATGDGGDGGDVNMTTGSASPAITTEAGEALLPQNSGCAADGASPTDPPSPAAATALSGARTAGAEVSSDGTTDGGISLAPAPAAATAAGAGAGAALAAADASVSASAGADADAGSGGEVCSICLSEFEDGERIKHLPCKHFYHVPCIDQWLGRDITCPLCKDNVLEAMRTLFGPLPPRNPSRQGPRGSGNGAASDDGGAPPGGAAAAGADGGAAAGGGGGGGQLELVVIVQSDGTAGGNGGGGNPGGPGLPGSIDSNSAHGVASGGSNGGGGYAASLGAPSLLASGAAAAAAVGSPVGSPVRLAAGALGSGAAGGAPVAVPGGGPDLHAMSTAQSRELRTMRRNISTDLNADQDGTSTDSDSDDSGSEDHGAAAAAAFGAAGAIAGGPAAGVGRQWALPHPSPTAGAAAVTAAGAAIAPPLGAPPRPGGGGNQLAVAVAAAGGSGGPGSYLEMTGHAAPSSRPVAEHVQSSSSSSSTAMRWIGGSGQVAPMPMPPTAGAAGGAGHNHHQHRAPPQARAQEAQMAAAAAALSAAAAATSGGSYSNSAGGGGNYSPRRGLLEHAGAAGGGVTDAAAAAAAAAAAILNFRVHDNPLARSQKSGSGPSGDSSFEGAVDAPSAAAAGASGYGSHSQPPPAHQAQLLPQGAPAQTVSATIGSAVGNASRGGAGGIGGGSSSVRAAGVLAVPEVAVGGEDGQMVRTPSGARARQEGGAGGGGGNWN